MVDYNTKYIFNVNYEIFNKDSRYLFVDFKHATWFRTNESGYEFIKRMQTLKSIHEALEEAGRDFGFRGDFFQKTMNSFINELIENKILVEENEKIVSEKSAVINPNTIWVHVTNACNLACPFCYSDANKDHIYNIDYLNVLKFLRELPEEDRKKVIISGGEPFLYPHLKLLVSGLKELGFKVNIITNGTYGREKYPEIIPLIDLLQVSIDGSSECINAATRGTDSLSKTLSNIHYAKELGVKDLYVSFTANKNNIMDLPNMPEFLVENKINHIHITKLLPVGRGKDNLADLSPDREDYAKNVKKFKEQIRLWNQKIYAIRESKEVFLDEKDKTKFLTVSFAGDQLNTVMNGYKVTGCGAGDATININYNGKVYPCTSLNGDDECIGNIKDDDIIKIVEEGRRFAQELSVDNLAECKNCQLKYFCGGGCRACAQNFDCIKGKEPDCESYKERIWDYMWTLDLKKNVSEEKDECAES